MPCEQVTIPMNNEQQKLQGMTMYPQPYPQNYTLPCDAPPKYLVQD